MAEEEVIEIDMAQLKKMKVPELRAKLGDWGLETKGTKAELLARVDSYLKEQDEELLDEEEHNEEVEPPPATVVEDTKEEEEEEKTAAEPVVEKPPPLVEPSSPKKPKIDAKSPISEAERQHKRAERFGVVSEDTKKQSRAERFGLTLESGTDSLAKRPPTENELDQMKKRGARFGITPPCMAKVEEEDKKKKRMERFGLGVTELPTDARKKLRADRFGL